MNAQDLLDATNRTEALIWIPIVAMMGLTAATLGVSCHFTGMEETRIKYEDTTCETKAFAIIEECFYHKDDLLCLQELPSAIKACEELDLAWTGER